MKLVGLGLVVAAVGMAGGAVLGQTTASATRPAAAGATMVSATTRPVVAGLPIVTGDNSEETKRAAAKLGTVLEEAALERLDDVPLRKLLDYLAGELKVNLVVNWGALKGAGVTQQTPVSVRLRKVSGHGALQMVLENVAPGKLDYDVSDGVVEVSTREWFERQITLRSYAPGPLLANPFHAAVAADDGGVVNGATTQPESAGDKLADVIREMAGSQTWKPAGTTLKYVHGEIMVGATTRGQWEVSGIYGDMLRPIHVPADKGGKMEWPARLRELDEYKKVREALQADVADFTVAQKSFRMAIAYLRLSQDVQLDANWRALAAVKVDPEMEMSVKLSHVSFGTILGDRMAAVSPQREVVLDVSPEGVMTITTKAARPDRAIAAAFDVRDLIRRQVFLARGPRKPGTTELAGKIMTDLQAAGEKDGWWKEAVVREWEGLILVRATPEVVRAAGAALAGMAK